MKGDFTRDTFDLSKHYRRVLMQQGRVQVDADWNEQAAILLHYLRSLAADLFGPHGGPGEGFRIGTDRDSLGLDDEEWGKLKPELEPLESGDFYIRPGNYYVDGLLCENEGYMRYKEQPDPFLDEEEDLDEGLYLVYLDVWERYITYVQDDSIREVALGGPDTATRSKLVWQVKTWPAPGEDRDEAPSALNCDDVNGAWVKWQEIFQHSDRGRLKARATMPGGVDTTDPCITPPDARYRGAENQLYRVEVHHGGKAGEADKATFKWSRDNGSVVFPLSSAATETDAGTLKATLEHLGRDPRFGLAVDDWVELVDDGYELRGGAEPLWQVEAVDRVTMEVTLKRRNAAPSAFDVGQDLSKNPLLRRWDHKAGNPTEGGLQLDDDGAALIVEGSGDDDWLKLEDGVEIQFQSGEHQYRSGDYWLIPARTETQDVEWPKKEGVPVDLPPHGVDHHYAPLAIISVAANGKVSKKDKGDCRYEFTLTKNPVG